MATRTSHSSPCFLRVADASAASSASKITSLSTPFSLETASTTIRISLFTCLNPPPHSRREPCLTDLLERHAHALLVHLQSHTRIVHRQQRARVTAPPRARRRQLDLHPRADEAIEMRSLAQYPVIA